MVCAHACVCDTVRATHTGIDLFQTLSLFPYHFDAPWPPPVRAVLDVARLSTISVELAAPECAIRFSYTQKWLVVEAMPIAAMAALGVALAVVACGRCVVARRQRRANRLSMRDRGPGAALEAAREALRGASVVFVGGGCTLAYYAYFVTLTRALEVLKCTRFAGRWVLDAEPSMVCWEDGTPHRALLPYAIAALLVYGVGTPAAFARIFYANAFAIRRDQHLWLVGKGDSAATNADFAVRRQYARLYQDFGSAYFAWRLVLMLRKTLLLLVAVFLRDNFLLQTTSAIGILCVGYCLQQACAPFVSAREQLEACTKLSVARRGGVGGGGAKGARASATATRSPGGSSGDGAGARHGAGSNTGRKSTILGSAARSALEAGRRIEHITDFNVRPS